MNIFLSFVVLVLTARAPTEPTFKVMFRTPPPPMEGTWYQACNPLLSEIELTIECGQDYDPLKLPLTPRICQDVVIKDPNRGSGTFCTLQSWKKVAAK